MELILLKDVENLGYKHDLVTVKNGYGRNYLIPQGMAVIANAPNRKKLEAIKEEIAAKEAARVGEYKEMAKKLEGQTLKIGVKAGKSGKIFGSVTNIQVANALVDQYQIEVERKKIELPAIKEVGNYDMTINFHEEVIVVLPIELVAE